MPNPSSVFVICWKTSEAESEVTGSSLVLVDRSEELADEVEGLSSQLGAETSDLHESKECYYYLLR